MGQNVSCKWTANGSPKRQITRGAVAAACSWRSVAPTCEVNLPGTLRTHTRVSRERPFSVHILQLRNAKASALLFETFIAGNCKRGSFSSEICT